MHRSEFCKCCKKKPVHYLLSRAHVAGKSSFINYFIDAGSGSYIYEVVNCWQLSYGLVCKIAILAPLKLTVN